MKTRADQVLRDIPFQVYALAQTCTEQGSHERAMALAVYKSIKQDIQYALEGIEKDLKSEMQRQV